MNIKNVLPLRLLLMLLAAMFAACSVYSQDYFADTVWTNKTDQLQGFYKVKFSLNDSIIVGHGMEMDMFYDAKTGQEIKQIPGNDEVFFINNDLNFVRVNNDKNRFDIFNTKTFQVADSLISDDLTITKSPFADVSPDGKYFISQVINGFRIWDLENRKIVKTKIYPEETHLVSINFSLLKFNCDRTKIYCRLDKVYEDPKHPGDQTYYYSTKSILAYGFDTLDSLEELGSTVSYRLSKKCLYIAKATGDPTNGVEVYDLNTKKTLWEIPVNGPSLSGIEFSPDDKYLVTSNPFGWMSIWDLSNGKSSYDYKDSGYENFNVSHNGKYIIWSSGRNLFLYNSKFGGVTVNDKKDVKSTTIYPNPTTGSVTVQFNQPATEMTNIALTDMNGKLVKPLFNGFLQSGKQSVNLNTLGIGSGSYFITVQNMHISFTFKLIVSK